MRVCSVCLNGRWNGSKKDNKFVCASCLAKRAEEKRKLQEGEDKKEAEDRSRWEDDMDKIGEKKEEVKALEAQKILRQVDMTERAVRAQAKLGAGVVKG
jgi:phosphosulfolactate phosphohydrolase-like enzyme